LKLERRPANGRSIADQLIVHSDADLVDEWSRVPAPAAHRAAPRMQPGLALLPEIMEKFSAVVLGERMRTPLLGTSCPSRFENGRAELQRPCQALNSANLPALAPSVPISWIHRAICKNHTVTNDLHMDLGWSPQHPHSREPTAPDKQPELISVTGDVSLGHAYRATR
jgi:hypothetical protein